MKMLDTVLAASQIAFLMVSSVPAIKTAVLELKASVQTYADTANKYMDDADTIDRLGLVDVPLLLGPIYEETNLPL